MRYVLLALLAAVLLVTAAFWSKLNIILRYSAEEFSLTLKLWCFKYSLSFAQKEDAFDKSEKNEKAETDEKKKNKKRDGEKEKKGVFERVKDGFSLFKSAKRAAMRALKYLKHKIDIQKIFIKCRFGTGNAAATGMICGAVWGTVGNIYILGGKFFNLAFPSIELTPVFESKIFELEAESIIRVRPAHIINALILALFTYFISEKKTIKRKDLEKI